MMDWASMKSTVDADQLLRAAGLRVTAPRKAVFEEVVAHPHADVHAIARAVRAHEGTISTQAVYDVLRALTAAELVRRIEPAGSPARFEARVGDNHHHIVCRICGSIADVNCAVGSAPCMDPHPDHGFVVDETEVTYWGYCPACSRPPAAASQADHNERLLRETV
jgi:Fur family transcriptional regulator, stress-responsive regulator